jgi:hypothetical protein
MDKKQVSDMVCLLVWDMEEGMPSAPTGQVAESFWIPSQHFLFKCENAQGTGKEDCIARHIQIEEQLFHRNEVTITLRNKDTSQLQEKFRATSGARVTSS